MISSFPDPGVAVVFRAPRQVEVESFHLPQPTVGEVLVETSVSAISAGTEMLVYRGELPADLDRADENIPALSGALTYPLRYGYAAVGRVVKLGPDVPSSWLDRLVFSFQPHASHFVAPVEHLHPVPDGIEPEDAVFLPFTETALTFLHDGAPLVGERIVVFGQGVVGLVTTALLARVPLATLVVLDQAELRRRLATDFGAQAAIDPVEIRITAPGTPQSAATSMTVPDLVQQALGGERPDLVYELSGAPAALDSAIQCVSFDGRIVVGSWYGSKSVALNLGGHFHRGRVHLISSQVSTVAPTLTGRWTKERRIAAAWRAIAAIRPSRLVTHRFDIQQAASAYALVDQRPPDALQVLLTYARE